MSAATAPNGTANRGVQRLQAAFEKARAENRAAFVPFMTAGYPSYAKFPEIAHELLQRADILEVGLPYSDPLGDGPTIQRASEQALAGGTSTHVTIELVRELRRTSDTPIVIMTYVNPIYAVGPEKFMELCAEAGVDGLILGQRVARDHGMLFVTEVMDTRDVDVVAEHADILQIGARNMHNFALLREVGRARRPVLLKRGLSATIEEWLYAAEYILSEGNSEVILCERGIRTYEKWTRNTLDLSAVALAKQMTHLPVIVDVTHAAGRRDLLIPLAKAAIAVGADGIHVEVHPNPVTALSDNEQQLDFAGYEKFTDALSSLLKVPAHA